LKQVAGGYDANQFAIVENWKTANLLRNEHLCSLLNWSRRLYRKQVRAHDCVDANTIQLPEVLTQIAVSDNTDKAPIIDYRQLTEASMLHYLLRRLQSR
jgi:hypothetical protein